MDLGSLEDVTFLGCTFQEIDKMHQLGLIGDWAVGGSVASLLSMGPTHTDDLDLIVQFPGSGLLIDPSPIFQYAKSQGFPYTDDHIRICGVSVQFLPIANDLAQEAVKHAKCFCIGSTHIKFLDAEYLMAMMLELGRGKDKLRLLKMMQESGYDEQQFGDIVKRHGLLLKLAAFRKLVE